MMSETLKDTDVAIFYNNDNEKDRKYATDLEEELRLLPRKAGKPLNVASYDDLPLGYSKVESRIWLTQVARVICLIVTPDFINDRWNNFESVISIHEKVESGKPKVVYVHLCEATKVNLVLQHLTCIYGVGKSQEDIARRITELHDLLVENEATAQIISLNSYKLHLIMAAVTAALDEHFQIDKMMKDLYAKMNKIIKEKLASIKGQRKNPISTPTTDKIGCDCSEGELWKEEIQKKDYWSTDVHPFRSIRKSKDDHKKKHSDDIHKLICGNGHNHVALAPVFLTKRQIEVKDQSQCSNVVEFLDTDGILQLLKNCAEFTFSGGNTALQVIHDARHLVSHIPHNFGPADQQEATETVKKVARSLYGGVSPKVWKKLEEEIEKIDTMIIEARVQKVNDGAVSGAQSCAHENCEEHYNTLSQKLKQELETAELEKKPAEPETVTSTATLGKTSTTSVTPKVSTSQEELSTGETLGLGW